MSDDSRSGYLWAGAAVVLIAAAVWFSLPRRAPPLHRMGNGIVIQLSRAGRTRALSSGDSVRAGDTLRVRVTLAKPGQVSAKIADANQREREISPSVALPAGESTLTQGVVVDNPCADLRVIVKLDTATLSVPLRCEK